MLQRRESVFNAVRSVENDVRSDSCVYERGEGATVYKKAAPFSSIVRSCGLRSGDLSQREPLLFERRNLFADCPHHLPKFIWVGFVANTPMPRNHVGVSFSPDYL